MRHEIGVLFAFILIAITPVAAQSDEHSEYLAAVSKQQTAERMSALESFLAAHPQSSLKLDALELLVWNSRTAGSLADLEHWSGQLLSVFPRNPLAAAIIIDSSLAIAEPMTPADRAKRALPELDGFDRPEGFSHEDFTTMKNFVTATLNGVVGYSYFEKKDFMAARPYLRKAAELLPNNAQFAYTLALSDLGGGIPDQAEGFRYLARSVNLAKGTPAGDELSRYARQRYQDVGGSNADWDKFLVATAVPVRSATSTQPAGITSTAKPPSAPVPQPAPAQPPTHAASAPASPSPASSTTSIARATAGPSPAPTPAASEPTAPARVMPPRKIPQLTPGAPISFGLLIQSALTERQTRQPIIYGLSDFVRRLNDKDEAFIVSFSKGMVFEEDLTSNTKALESAMDSVVPAPGAALYDAVTFAAGHLNRIARNSNRVLVVLADEGDRNSSVSPLELSSQINLSGVRIYCIGIGISAQSDHARLEQLAGYTGGRAFFIDGPNQFRSVVRTISNELGISYPN